MNKRLKLNVVVLGFWVMAFLICNPQNVYSSDTNSSEMLTKLPFDLGEWVEWSSAMGDDAVGGGFEIGKYKEHYLEKNESLQQLINSVYPQYLNYRYYILQTDKANCEVYVIMSSQDDITGLFFHLVTVRDNKKIASLDLGGLIGDDDSERKNFIIAKNLKISLFDEKVFYNEKKDRVEVTKKKKTGTYQIQKDGQIVKLD